MTDKQKQRMKQAIESENYSELPTEFMDFILNESSVAHGNRDKPAWHYSLLDAVNGMSYEAALAEPCGGCEELVEALEFYASEIYHYYAPCNQDPEVLQDNGELAKEALSRYKKSHGERQAGDE